MAESDFRTESAAPESSRHRDASAHRKALVHEFAERFAATRLEWKDRAGYFHEADLNYMRFLVPEGKRVLDIGCGAGDLLAALNPSHGVGIDLSEKMIAQAQANFPDHTFFLGDIETPSAIDTLGDEPFDFIILSDVIGLMEDCQATLESLQKVCGPRYPGDHRLLCLRLAPYPEDGRALETEDAPARAELPADQGHRASSHA